jgi:hypothetical protein
MEIRVNEDLILEYSYNLHRGGYYNGSISDLKLTSVILCAGGLEIDITDRLTPLELNVMEDAYADRVVEQHGERSLEGDL